MAQIIKYVRNQMPRPAKDEQGITLQTLIVTAVLVLMAVAAGVIIAAITNSSSDDLEEQSQDLDALCAPWELHDPVLEANAAGGGGPYINGRVPSDRPTGVATNPGRGGVTSSKIGCLPVCYLTLNDHLDKTIDKFLLPTDTPALTTSTMREDDHFNFDTSNRLPKLKEIRIGVVYKRRIAAGTTRTEIGLNDKLWNYGEVSGSGQIGNPEQVGTAPPFTDPGSKLIVRVSDDKEACVIEDTSTPEGEIILRSN